MITSTAELVRAWLDGRQARGEITAGTYRVEAAYLRSFVQAYPDLASVDRQAIADWQATLARRRSRQGARSESSRVQMKAGRLAPSTRRGMGDSLGRFLRWLARDGLLGEDLSVHIVRVHKPRPPARPVPRQPPAPDPALQPDTPPRPDTPSDDPPATSWRRPTYRPGRSIDIRPLAYTTAQAARVLACHEQTVRRLVRRGELATVPHVRRLLITPASLTAYTLTRRPPTKKPTKKVREEPGVCDSQTPGGEECRSRGCTWAPATASLSAYCPVALAWIAEMP